jgi:iron complex transport system substrate-binding protein
MRRPAVLAAVLVSLLAGCGSGSEAGEPEASPGAGAPVTIEHEYGETTLDAVPQRVVTLDLQWTDTMLAMGVEPVGYAIDTFAPEPVMPWQEPGDGEQLDVSDGVPLEQIAALQPDLIVGSYPIADEGTYDRLSQIAPTIAQFDAQQVTPWPRLAEVAGQALRDPERATSVVAGVEDQVATAAEELPGLTGRSFALAQYQVGTGLVIVADPEDGSSQFFRGLGMELLAPLAAEGERTGEARLQVSTERADLLQADLVAFLVNGGDESDLADVPGFDTLPGTTAVLDYPTIVGLNTPSPLSIPYSLERLRPYLDEAAA